MKTPQKSKRGQTSATENAFAFSILASLVLLLGSLFPAGAQTSYFRAVTNLNPAGYWPMHEVESPAPGTVETNLGSLGALGNGYYGDWIPLTGNAKILHQNPGALTVSGDNDSCAFFTNAAAGGPGPNFLLIPHTSPLLTIKPPFTLEAWVKSQVATFSAFMGEGGYVGYTNSGNYDGFQWNWNGANINMYLYDGVGTATAGGVPNSSAGGATSPNNWFHTAFTYDGTNAVMYLNGVGSVAGTVSPPMNPSIWSPLTIGNGKWQGGGPQRNFLGYVDEVAIYTNVLAGTDIYNHYQAGVTPGSNPSYYQNVINNGPIVYLRMNSPAYTQPALSTWPMLLNYGSAVTNSVFGSLMTNGVYTPGTLPGAVAGTAYIGFPTNLLNNQVALLSAMGTFANAGSNALFNPTGSSATFSVSALFRGNPADPRIQSIISHSTNSWQLVLNQSGFLVFNAGTGGATAAGSSAAGDLIATNTYNDGLWHHVVAVHNITNNFIYVDGALAATNVSTVSIPGSTKDVFIGDDACFTNANNNLGRAFSGQVCEAAFFTNALQATDVQTLYSNLAIVPFIVRQPVSATLNGGTTLSNSVMVFASPTLVYQWYFNSSSNYTGAKALTNSSDGRISGATAASLVITNLRGNDAGFYYVVATNNYGAVTSSIAALSVNTSPAITAQFPVTYTNQITLFTRANPIFSVVATGANPLTYYWFTNGVVAGGATTPVYAVINAQLGSPTNFQCVVSNFLGTVTSVLWSVAYVVAPAAPYPQSVLGLNPIGYWRMNETDDAAGNQGALCHDYAGGNNALYANVNLGLSGYNPILDPADTAAQFGYFANPNSYAGQIGMNVDLSAPAGSNAQFSVAAWVNGSEYLQRLNAGIVAKGYFNAEEFSLDTGASGSDFRFEVRAANGTPYNANTTVNPYTTGWHFLVGVCDQAAGKVLLYVDGVVAGSATIPAGSGITNSAIVPVMIGARASTAVSGGDYQFIGLINDVAIYRSALSPATIYYQYTNAGAPPFFTQQPPADVYVSEGGTLTVSAAVDGTGPLAYQWHDANNVPQVNDPSNPTLTNATLVVSNASLVLDFDTLTLTVTNVYGSRDSTPVTVHVVSGPPQITASNLPPLVTLLTGQSYTYSVQASGTLPLSYQWYFSGSAVPGQTNSAYSLVAGSPGTYAVHVVITNVHASITSSDSTLKVLARSTNTYAAAVLAYGPVGYWPLQETAAPAPANLETNLGTLGSIGDAYYAATNATDVSFGQGGVTADGDLAAGFHGVNGVTPTSYAYVPRVNPALTMQPPLTYEAWILSSSTQFGDIIGQGGSGLNSPAGAGNWGGIRLAYGGNATGGPNLQAYAYTGNGTETLSFVTLPNSLPINTWHHCVLTFDGATCMLYIDGVLQATNSSPFAMAPDTWSPLTIGAGRWQGSPPAPTRGISGTVDEVAVYTNVLSALRVNAHYQTAISSGNYVQAVQTDHPLLYYRMDNPLYLAPDPSLEPTALNFGSSPVNGAYGAEIVPGAVSGPPIACLGATNVAAPINGVFSCIDAGFEPAFSPAGTQPFTALAWFRSYPSDGRVQSIMSQGANWSLNLDGTTGLGVWSSGAGSVSSTVLLNDATWHLVAGVYDGARNYLYLDGALNNSAVASGTVPGDPTHDLSLGGNAAFALVGVNQQFFGGAIAHAAFYTNALTAGQVQHIYDASRPTIAIAASGTNVLLTYTGSQLLSATNVAGPYAPVLGASSPYLVPATNAQKFYRAHQ